MLQLKAKIAGCVLEAALNVLPKDRAGERENHLNMLNA